MRSVLRVVVLTSAFSGLSCAGCLGFGEGPSDDDARMAHDSSPPQNQGDLDPDAGGMSGGDDASESAPDDGALVPDGGHGDAEDTDAASPDVGGTGDDLDVPDVCGDGTVTGGEACDDGNTVNGDYCDELCSRVTGRCGDGTLQAGESCDDASTADCAGTHDGGDGSCVPPGTCAAGYALSGGACVPNSTGLSVPCQNGSGFTLFRYHYSNNSTSAQIDVWDANCSYSFAPGSACNVYEICPGFCDPDTTSEGYPIFDASDYMRVRFDVNGLSFSQATLYIAARSYATSSSADVELWSPLYGGYVAGPIDNDFVYDTYALDWTGYLYPSDDPNLTAIQLYGARGRVAIKAVELCVE